MKTSIHYIVSASLPASDCAGIVSSAFPSEEMFLTSDEHEGAFRTKNSTIADQWDTPKLAKEMMEDYINGCSESDDTDEQIESVKNSINVYKIEVINHGIVEV